MAPPARRLPLGRGSDPRSGPLAGLADGLLDLVLPAECAACGRAGSRLCDGCAAELGAALQRPSRVEGGAAALPLLADGAPLPVMAAGLYAPPLSTALLAFKDHHGLHLRRTLGEALARAVAALRLDLGDRRAHSALLVPVPGSSAGFRRRGYDPLEELCRSLPPERMRRDLVRRGPVRVGRRSPGAEGAGASRGSHAGADARARRRRVRGWAAAPGRVPPGTPVILLDDVLTTGATLAALHEAVLRAGAEPIGAATVAGVPPPRSPLDGALVRGVRRE